MTKIVLFLSDCPKQGEECYQNVLTLPAGQYNKNVNIQNSEWCLILSYEGR